MSLIGEQVVLRASTSTAPTAHRSRRRTSCCSRPREPKASPAHGMRGIVGFGHRGELIRHSRWTLVDHVPVVVEIVDAAERITHFVRAHRCRS